MSLKRSINKFALRVFQNALRNTYANSALTKLFTLQGEIASRQVRTLERLTTLADAEFSVFSQWGEDGIIEWLIHCNGPMPETFVEFGVETYRESNTRFLLLNRNWCGLIIDGSPSNIDVARSDTISWRHDLTARCAFITKDNINGLIKSSGFSGEIGILSVDIDGNDYWVWDAINCVSPHFIIAEYNSVFGDVQPLTIPYDASFVRARAHHSNLYYGASIGALCALGERNGYTLLGTNRAGSNAFFVRNDRARRFIDRIGSVLPRPSRFREARDRLGNLAYTRSRGRADIIADCPVVNITDGRVAPLGSIAELYTPRWSAILDGGHCEDERAP